MKLTASYPFTAAVNPESRRIIGLIVPFNEQGTPGVAGQGVTAEVKPGGFTWDAESMPLLRSVHHTEPIGRAVTLDESDTGIVASFTVAKTRHADDALVLAAEGLQAGLSVEAEVPDDFQADADGVFRLTAENPGKITAVALVESPAFQSARVHEVAASRKVPTMADEVTEPTEVDPSAMDRLTDAVTTLTASLTASLTADTAEALPERLTAATSVQREPFPYGFDGAEGGHGFFKDLMDARISGNSAAAMRAEKAQSMLNEIAQPRGPQLTGANEQTVRSTLVVPNVYDPARYVEELVNPRVIADHVPGVSVDKPNPIVIPAFSSSAYDGGAAEPVIVSTEGTQPAQAEVATTTITATPLLYHGIFDVSRAAVDAGTPATEALIMRTLINSYNEVTEAAAVTAILANGTAGTDVASGADGYAEARLAKAAIRLEMAKMNTGLKAAPNAVLFASDVYEFAVATDDASGNALYPFLADKLIGTNQTANTTDNLELAIYGRPGYLAHKLTATKFVVVNWSGVIRFESPTQTFTFNEVVAPSAVRFALAGYFVQRTLQAQAARYFAQL